MCPTFYANPDEEKELWIERAAIDGYGFRIWHVMFFCFAGFSILIILICCCVKFRIPRTKQQIESDYQRKKLAEKFRDRLRLIRNQDMDSMDLQRALEIIQATSDYNLKENQTFMHAEPQQPITFAKKLVNVMNLAKFSPNTSK